MNRRGKILRIFAGTFGLLVLLLAALVALAPRWIHLEQVRARIQEYASEALGGDVRFERIDLSYFPRPSVLIRQLQLSLPGKARGTVRNVRVYPAILSLHRGGIRLVKIQAEEPDFTVETPEAKKKGEELTLPEIREKVTHALQILSSGVPELVVEVDGGRLALSRQGKTVSSFRDIHARVTLPPKMLLFEARCASNLWENLSVKGSLDPEGLAGKGELSVTHVDLAALGGILLPDGGFGITGEKSDLAIAFSTKGLRTLDADVRGAFPSVSLRRGRRVLAVEGARFDGAIQLEEGKTEATLSRLSVESPRLRAEGTLRADDTVPRVELTLSGGDLDVTRVRERLLSFAGDLAPLPEILDYFRGGRLTAFSFAVGGKSFADLGVLKRMSIRGNLVEGNVHIKDVGLDLAEARGDVALERGVLSVERAAARIGNSRASEGTVRVGLGAGEKTLRVDAHVRADLSEMPEVLSRVVGSKALDEELSLVESLSGSATGRIHIGDRTDSLKTSVALSEMRLDARYRRVPFPLRILDAKGFYDGERIGVSDLSGKVGNSTLSGVAVRVRIGKTISFEDASGTVDASLDELYPWMTSSDVMGEAAFPVLTSYKGAQGVGETLRELRGSANVALARLSGPIERPREWQFEATGSLKNVSLKTPIVPWPVTDISGAFRIDTDNLELTNLQARAMDASLRITGTLDGYRQGFQNARATVDGEIGPGVVRWAWDNASLPPEFLPATPIGLRDARFGLDNDGLLSVAGTYTIRNGPVLAVDAIRDREGIDVRDLTIRDDDSSASMAFKRKKEELGVRFNGRLSATTLDRLFAERRTRRARLIEGDFLARIPLAHPAQTTAEGTLEASDLHLTTPAGPLAIDRLGLKAAKNRITVSSPSLALGELRFSVAGDATVSDEGVVLDMDLATDGIAWDNVANVLAGMKADGRRAPPPFPVTGTVRVSAGFFTYGGYTWKPVRVDLRMETESTTATVREADLCGVATRGEVRFLDNDVLSVDLVVTSSGPDINAPLSCLGSKHARLTGSYRFQAAVTGKGTGSELPRAVRGTLKLEAANGHIGKADVLARVLALLNVTEVFVGKVPDLFSRTMPYNHILMEGNLEDGKFLTREGVLNSPSITLAWTGNVDYLDETVDLVFLAHPLTTVDKIIGVVPVVRYILGGHLVSVAAKVTGKVDDPKVSILPGREVASGLVDMLGRTLKLPVEVITPITR